MNSINIGTASAGSSFGLFTPHNRSLSASRHSIARSVYSSTSNMAAAMVSSNKGKSGQDGDGDHHRHLSNRIHDPVELRTCTVENSFRRMEVCQYGV